MSLIFEKYHEALLPEVKKIFRSNIPRYFFEYEEEQLVHQLNHRIFDYFVMIDEGQCIGAGGIGLNSDETVSLCWGMIHQDYHKKKYGEALLLFRLERITQNWPGKTVVNVTSQHTTGFFEKYGFKVVSVKENGFGPGLHECRMELK